MTTILYQAKSRYDIRGVLLFKVRNNIGDIITQKNKNNITGM